MRRRIQILRSAETTQPTLIEAGATLFQGRDGADCTIETGPVMALDMEPGVDGNIEPI